MRTTPFSIGKFENTYNKFEFGAVADINAMNMQNLAALAAIASNGNGIQSLGSGESAQPEFSHTFFWIR
jgi:hypothetical protein